MEQVLETFKLSISADSDFMALYDRARKAVSHDAEVKVCPEELFKHALINLLERKEPITLPVKRLTKAEKAKLDYIASTSEFIPRIIRRAA